MPSKRRTQPPALTRLLPRVAPPRLDHAFAFPRLPQPAPSDESLILTLYSVSAAAFYGQHGVWPRFAAPGCACGIEVVAP